jgi:hypothetical protein
LKEIQESIKDKQFILLPQSFNFFIYLIQSIGYIYMLFFRAQVLPPMLYESMKTVALFVRQPIADYCEYLDQ